MDMVLSEKGIEDIEEILELQKLAYMSEAEIYHDFTIQPLRQTLKEIKEEYENQKILKVEFEGRIVGSVRAYQAGNTCFIGKLIVHPSEQNRGIDTILLLEGEIDGVRRKLLSDKLLPEARQKLSIGQEAKIWIDRNDPDTYYFNLSESITPRRSD